MAKRITKKKITITIHKKLLKKVDKIKKFPKWNENRSAVIEEALQKMFNKNA